MTNIERKLIVNEISLNKLFTYNNSVYDIGEKFNSLERKSAKINSEYKTEAVTGAKLMMVGLLCHHKSINELITTAHNKQTSFANLFGKREYIPKMHGFRDCIINTYYKQIENINYSVIEKAKENKIFIKNRVDGLTVVAHDGVEMTETNKNINNLPEREHQNGEIKKYIKYLCTMNVGPKVNIMISTKQLTEKEKIITETGKKKAKTIGETTALLETLPILDKIIGRCVDVNVMDALFLNVKVMQAIKERNQYFVIRMEDDTKNIYKDAEGLFKNRKSNESYEIVEITKEIDTKYSKAAKRKDTKKTKKRTEKRPITDNKINDRRFIKEEVSVRKNSVKKTKVYEKVIRKIEVWDDVGFTYSTYDGELRVIRSVEKYWNGTKEVTQEIYIVTNMLYHQRSTIIKIMHLRWHIENCGFRKIKQQFNFEHIFIGELNAINYIFQMMILVSNLLELYLKIRLKELINLTYVMIGKIFEKEIQNTKNIGNILLGIP